MQYYAAAGTLPVLGSQKPTGMVNQTLAQHTTYTQISWSVVRKSLKETHSAAEKPVVHWCQACTWIGHGSRALTMFVCHKTQNVLALLRCYPAKPGLL